MHKIQQAVGTDFEVRSIEQMLPGIVNTCEIQSTRVNKSDAISGLCRELNIDIENVWAFGDDANDKRMLKEMGWGVRMRNHDPCLAQVGDDITTYDNENDGFATYLSTHVLGESVRNKVAGYERSTGGSYSPRNSPK